MPTGDGQAIVTGLYSTATSSFDASRKTVDTGRFEKATGSVFVEYGLDDDLTLVGNGEFGSERSNGARYGNPILKDLGLGARYRLYASGGFVASGQLMGRFEGDPVVPRGIGVDWQAPEIEARALAGYGFDVEACPVFLDTQAAYRARFGSGPDEAKVDLTIGFRPRSDVLLLAQSFSTVSVGSARPDARSYDYHKVAGSVVYDIDKTWSIQAGGFATAAGRNALRERGAISALWLRF